MVDELRKPGWRVRWGALVTLMAIVMSGTGWQGTGPAAADPLVPRPTTGTATGIYRTGLARAGLVSLTELGDTHVWVGLRSVFDANARFDVQVELLQDGVPVASGLRRCVGLPLTSVLQPQEVVIPWDEFAAPTIGVGDVLATRVSTRIGTNADGSRCGHRTEARGLRLFHDSRTHPSRFTATITPDPAVTLYLQSKGEGCSARPALTLSEEAPTARVPRCRRSGRVRYSRGNAWAPIGTWDLPAQVDFSEEVLPEVRNAPPAPEPEPISVERLPLPPAAPSATPGSCDATVNPQRTGCIAELDQLGGFIDDHHLVGNVVFAGAPEAPDPASIYTGGQVIIVKTNGETFSNGSAWKCVTCGIPEANRQGVGGATDYPQPFRDGKRILRGTSIIDCGPHRLVDDACTPEVTHVHPIVWDTGSTPGVVVRLRELRIHPDGVHLGWNTIVSKAGGGFDQFGVLGRLEFDPAPTTGTPLVPRYDLRSVSFLLNTTDPTLTGRMISVDPANPDRLRVDRPAGHIGEFRGFTSDGRSALGIGTEDSCNWDPWATDLRTGESRRLGRNPNYMDPMNSSPDDNWTVIADGRTDNRMAFLGAMPGVPPVVDLVGCALRDIYNNGERRFFQPFLLDRYGDRGSYHGQQINGGEDPTPGSNSISDPLWAARADPQWSPDGTAIAYWQTLVTAPACGGANPLACPASNEPGGRRTRWFIARLTSRAPVPPRQVAPIQDDVPWGTPYETGGLLPVRTHIPGGTYTLPGKVNGSADVVITENAERTGIDSIEVTYHDFTDDGINIINGRHTRTASGVYHENLTLSGARTGTRLTSEPGGWIYAGATRTGTLTTTIDGVTYTSPPSNQ